MRLRDIEYEEDYRYCSLYAETLALLPIPAGTDGKVLEYQKKEGPRMNQNLDFSTGKTDERI